ncbi:hypothetical protein CDL15_Pgr012422 [Punica granatum]|uniref:Uncharacterized protein n=1 Tax=Punica granatum TaxID=22663 RepID=A0A218WZD5_PUNGR|nr:hypothetical protein CDL15_Pgr012422 [Punica granatum]
MYSLHMSSTLVEQKVKPDRDVVWPDHDLSWTGLIRLLMRFKELRILDIGNEALSDYLHELVFGNLVDLKNLPISALGRLSHDMVFRPSLSTRDSVNSLGLGPNRDWIRHYIVYVINEPPKSTTR